MILTPLSLQAILLCHCKPLSIVIASRRRGNPRRTKFQIRNAKQYQMTKIQMKNTVNLKIPYNSPGQIWWEGVRGRGKIHPHLTSPFKGEVFYTRGGFEFRYWDLGFLPEGAIASVAN